VVNFDEKEHEIPVHKMPSKNNVKGIALMMLIFFGVVLVTGIVLGSVFGARGPAKTPDMVTSRYEKPVQSTPKKEIKIEAEYATMLESETDKCRKSFNLINEIYNTSIE